METTLKPCIVCNEDVEVAVDMPEDEPVLCKVHYFTEDLSEEWEKDDD